MTERDRKIVYYYYCLFRQNKNLYYEFYDRTVFDRTYTYSRLSAKGHDFVNSSYHEAVHTYELDPTEYSKDGFFRLIAQDGFYRSRKYLRTPWMYRDYWRKSSYRKQSYHCKKEISEETLHKNEWRKKKGFAKDQSKTKTWKRNAGKYYKQLSNQMHRAWIKNEMTHGREVCNNDYKWFIDKWMWS